MMKKMILIMMMIFVCVQFAWATDYTIWSNYGNDPALDVNKQTGYQTANLAQDKSITYNTALQPYVFDFGGTSIKEYVVFYTGFIRVYIAYNLSFITELSIGMNKPTYQDTVDLDGDGTSEFITMASSTANSSTVYFNAYKFNGVAVSVYKSFQIDLNVDPVGGFRCGSDWDSDSKKDCLFIASLHENASKYVMEGYDRTTTSADVPRVHMNLSYHGGATSIPQFIDANFDSQLEALIYNLSHIVVINHTGEQVIFNHKATLSNGNDQSDLYATWYNKDSGVYEIIYMARTSNFQLGDGYTRSGLVVGMDSLSGTNLWETPYGSRCPDTAQSGGSNAGGCSFFPTYYHAMSLGYSDINDGRIYSFGSCEESSVTARTTYICAYDKDGNVFSRDDVPSDTYPFTTKKIVWANMAGGTNLEAVFPKAVVGLDGAVVYSPMGDLNNDGWCLPVDLDGNGKLEMICSQDGVNTTIFIATGAGSGVNSMPNFAYLTIDNEFADVNQEITGTVYADDPEDDILYCAVNINWLDEDDSYSDYDYKNGVYPADASKMSSVQFPCTIDTANNIFQWSYSYNGTFVVKAYVIDSAHITWNGAYITTPFSQWESIDQYNRSNRTIQVGAQSQSCFPPFILCENFDYTTAIRGRGWSPYVNTLLLIDSTLAPTGNKLVLSASNNYKFTHAINPFENSIVTLAFKLTANYTTNLRVELLRIVGDSQLLQPALKFNANNITVFDADSQYPNSGTVIGTYANNSNDSYNIVLFYENVQAYQDGRGANTFDVYQNGTMIASKLSFFHASGIYPVNDSSVRYYTNLLRIYSDAGNAILDDIYLYKGTDIYKDNTLELIVLPQIPHIEDDVVDEYWGCYKVKGTGAKGYDCGYTKYNCQTCCGYVDNNLVVVKTGCTLNKVIYSWAVRIRSWFTRNIWYFMFFGLFAIVIVLIIAKVRGR